MTTLPRLRSFLLLTGIAWLTACSVIPETEPVKVYQLPAPTTQRIDAPPAPASLRINTPHAGIATSATRILVNPEGEQISAYKGARWSDPAPALLREHLTRAFNRSGAVEQVSSDDHSLHADYHLMSDLRQFRVTYVDGPPRVVIELDARLVDPSNRRMLASRTFVIEQTLNATEVPSVVQAFGDATGKLESELIGWTRDQLMQASPRQ